MRRLVVACGVVLAMLSAGAWGEGPLDVRVKELVAREKSAEQVVNMLRRQTGINLVVNWNGMHSWGIAADDPISVDLHNVTVLEALEQLFPAAARTQEVYFAERDGVVYVGGSQPARNFGTVVSVYDVRDLLGWQNGLPGQLAYDYTMQGGVFSQWWLHPRGPQHPGDRYVGAGKDLIAALEAMTGSNQWFDLGGSWRMNEYRGLLTVCATREQQTAVEEVLAQMRLPVQVPAATRQATIPGVMRLPVKLFSVRAVTLEEAFAALQKETGVNLVARWHDLESVGVKRETRITLELENADLLQAVRELVKKAGGTTEPALTYRDQVVLISVDNPPEHLPSFSRVYDVRDLLDWHAGPPVMAVQSYNGSDYSTNTGGGLQASHASEIARGQGDKMAVRPEQLVTTLETVDPATWDQFGGYDHMRIFRGLLVVTTHSEETQTNVARALARFRMEAGR